MARGEECCQKGEGEEERGECVRTRVLEGEKREREGRREKVGMCVRTRDREGEGARKNAGDKRNCVRGRYRERENTARIYTEHYLCP